MQGSRGISGGSGGVGGTGTGGAGGHGGKGGNGGTGAAGGGGGTVKMKGTIVTGSGTVDASGGSGAAGGSNGGGGRFIFGQNASGGFSGNVVGAPHSITTAGTKDQNPFVGGMPATPMIPNLPIGAEIYGLTGNTLAEVDAAMGGSLPALDVNGVPLSQAAVALVRMHIGPVGYANDFPGTDMLLYLNLSGATIDAPAMAAGGALQTLLERGFTKSFTGSATTILDSLDVDGVYGTRVPSSLTTFFQIRLMGDGVSHSATALSLANGEALYVVPEPAAWVLFAAAVFGLLAFAARRRLLDHNSNPQT